MTTITLIETKFAVRVDATELDDAQLERMSEALENIMDDAEGYLRARIRDAGHLRGDLLKIERTEG